MILDGEMDNDVEECGARGMYATLCTGLRSSHPDGRMAARSEIRSMDIDGWE